MAKANPERHRSAIDVSLWGLSDMELLAVIDDLADENGWTSNYDIRLQLGEDIEETGHRSSIPTRIAWMRRYGWLEQDPNARGSHRLNAMGHALLDNPELSKSFASALDKLNPAQRLRLTREISQSGATAPNEIRDALRREWRRNLQRPKGR